MSGGEGSHNFGGPNPIGGRPQSPQGYQRPDAGPPHWQQPPAPAGPYPQGPYPPAGPPPGPPPAGGYPPADQFGAGVYGGPPPFTPGPSFGGPSLGAPQQPRNRRRVILTVAGAVIAVIVVVAGAVVVGVGGSDSANPKTAGDAVKGYLEALAEGDAAKALSYGLNQPPDTTLLTDEVLKKQIEKLPITDIKIVKSDDFGEVQVMANFGDNAIDETLYLKRGADGGAWKLENVAYPLDFKKDGGSESPALIDAITLFGKPMPPSGRPYLFPGFVDVATSNPNVAVSISQTTYLLNSLDYGVNPTYGFDISAAGKEAVKKVIQPLLTECAKSRELSPPGCPQDASAGGTIQGTATWTAPTKLDQLDFTGSIDSQGTQMVMGRAEFTLTLQATDAIFNVTNYPRSFWVEGKADMTKNPPTFAIRKG